MTTTRQKSFESLVETGRTLSKAVKSAGTTHAEFSEWDDQVAKWLNEQYPGSGAAAEWSALCPSPLATGGGTREDTNAWAGFRMCIQRRLKWLASHAPATSANDPNQEISSAIDEGRTVLDNDDPHSAHRDFVSWVDTVSNMLRRLHPGTPLAAEWSALPYSNLIKGGRWSRNEDDWTPFRELVVDRIGWLAKLIAMEAKPTVRGPATLSNKVFIVHGHNEALKESCARLLGKLGLEPVILHEQASRGKTIIEKFVDYADVGFAVVLLTADDQGGLKDADRSTNRPRARQNVILELGYFLGRLDRERVAAIYEPGVELPSDYDGVIWIEHDKAKAWQLLLAKEIRAAGFSIDLNAV